MKAGSTTWTNVWHVCMGHLCGPRFGMYAWVTYMDQGLARVHGSPMWTKVWHVCVCMGHLRGPRFGMCAWVTYVDQGLACMHGSGFEMHAWTRVEPARRRPCNIFGPGFSMH